MSTHSGKKRLLLDLHSVPLNKGRIKLRLSGSRLQRRLVERMLAFGQKVARSCAPLAKLARDVAQEVDYHQHSDL